MNKINNKNTIKTNIQSRNKIKNKAKKHHDMLRKIYTYKLKLLL